MTFTGKNLTTLHDALCRALEAVHADIAHSDYTAAARDAFEDEAAQYKRLLYRVRQNIEKEVTQ